METHKGIQLVQKIYHTFNCSFITTKLNLQVFLSFHLFTILIHKDHVRELNFSTRLKVLV